MQPRMLDIAKTLAGLYRQQAARQILAEGITRRLTDRTLALTPAEGWQGKNEGERKLAEQRTLAEDGYYQELTTQLAAYRDDLAMVVAEIQALEAERRALEWLVRQAITPGGPIETVLDDVQIEAEIDQAWAEHLSQTQKVERLQIELTFDAKDFNQFEYLVYQLDTWAGWQPDGVAKLRNEDGEIIARKFCSGGKVVDWLTKPAEV